MFMNTTIKQAICFAICALDVGFENPVFASIEIEYGDADIDTTGDEAISAEKHLVYYQVKTQQQDI
jgi:splicing factor 3B subunit 3